jgi:hypothetical protein
MLIYQSINEREIGFETICGFSRVANFHEYDGVTNDKTEIMKVLSRVT